MRGQGFVQDLRAGARGLRRNPGYAAVVVLTLGLGIAASTVVFSVLNPYLLRPLPYAEPDRLLQVEQVDPERGQHRVRFSLPQWEDWRTRTRAFEDLAAYRYRTANVTGASSGADSRGAERVLVSYATWNLFSVLGVGAATGRLFGEEDAAAGGEPVVVLSHSMWSGRYGADPAVIGGTIRVDGVPHTVIGVAPPEFNFPWNEIRMWVPARDLEARRDRQGSILVGRLREGWTEERARQDLLSVQRELATLHPDVDGQFEGVTIRPLREALNFAYPVIRFGLMLLLGAVTTLLLLACVNVASLTLARATARDRELAVRRALGAGRGRVATHLLAETGVLALAGGTLGLLLASLAMDVIGPVLPEGLYRVGTASLDWRVMLFALGVTAATPLVFGLSPALSASRIAPGAALRGGARGGADRGALRTRRALVVAQVGLAVVLVATTLLLARSFAAVQRVALGFDAASILTVEATAPTARYPDAHAVRGYYRDLGDRLGALPGVAAVGFTDRLPLNHETPTAVYRAAGDGRASDELPQAIVSWVSPAYFEAAGTPLLEGRSFRDGEGAASTAAEGSPGAEPAPVVVISRTLAERAWPGQSALGRSIQLDEEAVPATVIGVAGDVQWMDLTGAPQPHVYRPLAALTAARRFAVLRAADPAALAGAVSETAATVDPEVPVTVRPYEAILRESDFPWLVGSAALGGFGAMAVLLATLGIYGVVAYSVARRRRELGIRMALGATGRAVRGLVLREGVRLVGIGLAAGLVLALVVARLIAGFLFGVSPTDPVMLVGVVTLFTLVAVAASVLPARRAAAVEPQRALREE